MSPEDAEAIRRWYDAPRIMVFQLPSGKWATRLTYASEWVVVDTFADLEAFARSEGDRIAALRAKWNADYNRSVSPAPTKADVDDFL